jgi:small subunit ribosomal protein S1
MEENKKDEMSFAELLDANPETPSMSFSPGDKVSGTVVNITKDVIFLDLGGKSEGIVDSKEFMKEDGTLTVSKGDKVELRVSSVRDGIQLSKGIKAHGADALDILRDAYRNGIPVEGRVTKVIKGGFEVDISGVRSFCPISQIDLQYCEKPEEHAGARYKFRITEFKERGRNILVSRRALLQEEQEKRVKELMANLGPGAEFEGKVTRLTDFGAFVDLGGIEGMVHVSEISHARVGRPSEVLTQGQMVKVRVLKIEPDRGGRQKIGLSIKALEPDAWEKGLGFQEGEVIRGKISRLMEFGAFVEVAPGVDGLVPVSEISFERVTHPNKFLKEGDVVDLVVLKIDEEKRRISLSIKEASIRKRLAEEEPGSPQARLEVGQVLKGIVEDIKAYGIFVRLPQFGSDVRGLLPTEELSDPGKGDVKKRFPRGQEIQVEIVAIDEKGRIRLSQKSMEERADRESYSKFLEAEDKPGELGTFGELLKDLNLNKKETK